MTHAPIAMMAIPFGRGDAAGHMCDAYIYGLADDREDDAGDDREPDEDREPILGWTDADDQDGSDRFGEPWHHDEDEASRQPAVTQTPPKTSAACPRDKPFPDQGPG